MGGFLGTITTVTACLGSAIGSEVNEEYGSVVGGAIGGTLGGAVEGAAYGTFFCRTWRNITRSRFRGIERCCMGHCNR